MIGKIGEIMEGRDMMVVMIGTMVDNILVMVIGTIGGGRISEEEVENGKYSS